MLQKMIGSLDDTVHSVIGERPPQDLTHVGLPAQVRSIIFLVPVYGRELCDADLSDKLFLLAVCRGIIRISKGDTK